jgi:hypothetical protein
VREDIHGIVFALLVGSGTDELFHWANCLPGGILEKVLEIFVDLSWDDDGISVRVGAFSSTKETPSGHCLLILASLCFSFRVVTAGSGNAGAGGAGAGKAGAWVSNCSGDEVSY